MNKLNKKINIERIKLGQAETQTIEVVKRADQK